MSILYVSSVRVKPQLRFPSLTVLLTELVSVATLLCRVSLVPVLTCQSVVLVLRSWLSDIFKYTRQDIVLLVYKYGASLKIQAVRMTERM